MKQKCDENGILIEDVFGGNTAIECSECGNIGTRKEGFFICENCGLHVEEKINTAKNTLKRGRQTSA